MEIVILLLFCTNLNRTEAVEDQELRLGTLSKYSNNVLLEWSGPSEDDRDLPLWSRTSNCQHCYHIRVSKSAIPAHTIRSERCSIREKWVFRVVNKFSFISLLIIFCWNRRLWPIVRVTGLSHLRKISSKIFSKSSAALLSRHF